MNPADHDSFLMLLALDGASFGSYVLRTDIDNAEQREVLELGCIFDLKALFTLKFNAIDGRNFKGRTVCANDIKLDCECTLAQYSVAEIALIHRSSYLSNYTLCTKNIPISISSCARIER